MFRNFSHFHCTHERSHYVHSGTFTLPPPPLSLSCSIYVNHCHRVMVIRFCLFWISFPSIYFSFDFDFLNILSSFRSCTLTKRMIMVAFSHSDWQNNNRIKMYRHTETHTYLHIEITAFNTNHEHIAHSDSWIDNGIEPTKNTKILREHVSCSIRLAVVCMN